MRAGCVVRGGGGIKCLCKSVNRLYMCFLFLAIRFRAELGKRLRYQHSSSRDEHGLSYLQGQLGLVLSTAVLGTLLGRSRSAPTMNLQLDQ